MRVDPGVSKLLGAFSVSSAEPSHGQFGDMFAAAQSDPASVRMEAQGDGSFLMKDNLEEDPGSAQKEAAIVAEMGLMQGFGQVPFAMDLGAPVVKAVTHQVQVVLQLPGVTLSEPVPAFRVRFENSSEGLQIVIHLKDATLLEKARGAKDVLQQRLSETLDRPVLVRVESDMDRDFHHNLVAQEAFSSQDQGQKKRQQERDGVVMEEDDEELLGV